MRRITNFLAVRLYLTASFTPCEIRYHAEYVTDVNFLFLRVSSPASQTWLWLLKQKSQL